MRRAGVVVLSLILGIAACSSESSPPRSDRSLAERKDKPSPKPTKSRAAAPSPSPAITPTPTEEPDVREWWKREIDKVLKKIPMSIQVRLDGAAIYSHHAHNDRIPASTQKLLLSMALFDKFGPDKTFPTKLAARPPRKGVVEKDLWVIGTGNPAMAGNPVILDQLPPDSVNIDELVRALKKSGVKTIEGNVMAATGPFAHDWYAPGWKPFFPSSEVGLPTALTFNGNVYKQKYTKRPELKLAESLRRRIQKGRNRSRWRRGGRTGTSKAQDDRLRRISEAGESSRAS